MEKKIIWDQLLKNMTELNFSSKEQDIIKKEIMKKEAEQLRKK
jgi:serine/threonine kinase 38